MRWFSSGKKVKTLEDLSKEFGITLTNDPPTDNYESFVVDGVGESREIAKQHLFKNARSKRYTHISDIGYSWKKSVGAVVSAIGYRPKLTESKGTPDEAS